MLKALCWLPVFGEDNIQTLYSGQPDLGLTDWHSLVQPQHMHLWVPPPHPHPVLYFTIHLVLCPPSLHAWKTQVLSCPRACT